MANMGDLTMTFRPLHDRVLVRRVDEDTKTAGGIIFPDSALENPSQVVVVAVCSVGHILVLCFPPQRQGIRKNRSGRFFKSETCTSVALFLGPPCPLGEEEDMNC